MSGIEVGILIAVLVVVEAVPRDDTGFATDFTTGAGATGCTVGSLVGVAAALSLRARSLVQKLVAISSHSSDLLVHPDSQ
jgi:hypothetical protein